MILFRCRRLSTVPALPSARESIIEPGDICCSSCSSTIGARGNSPRPVAGHPSAGGERGVGARIRPRCTAPGLVGARRWLAGIAERQVALSTARVLTSQRLDEHPLALVVSNAVACLRKSARHRNQEDGDQRRTDENREAEEFGRLEKAGPAPRKSRRRWDSEIWLDVRTWRYAPLRP